MRVTRKVFSSFTPPTDEAGPADVSLLLFLTINHRLYGDAHSPFRFFPTALAFDLRDVTTGIISPVLS